MLALLDGPERAGKTTVANILRERYGATIRHWGPVEPDDRVYIGPLLEDAQSDGFVVWDRAWPSEHIYANLLGRDRRLRTDPWLGEYLYGRAFRTVGTRFILLGPDTARLAALRDAGDLPVDPAVERAAYGAYGRRFGYEVVENEHTEEGAERVADWVYTHASTVAGLAKVNFNLRPPAYAGPPNARVVFVGERPGTTFKGALPGGWLPFTSRLTTMLARDLGDFALECGWTNTTSCPPQALRSASLVVACGEVAERWVTYNAAARRVLRVDHPAYIYRFGKQLDRLTAHRETLNQIAKEFHDG